MPSASPGRQGLRGCISSHGRGRTAQARRSAGTPKGLIMKVGDYVFTTIYGRQERCKVLAIYAAATIDVECADGRCFRVSGIIETKGEENAEMD